MAFPLRLLCRRSGRAIHTSPSSRLISSLRFGTASQVLLSLTHKKTQICNHFLYKCNFLTYIVNMNTVAMNIRVDKNLKEQATELYNDLGLSLSSAINMFLRQSVRENGFPFKPQRTKRKSEIELAVEEADQLMKNPNAKTYNYLQELWDEIGI